MTVLMRNYNLDEVADIAKQLMELLGDRNIITMTGQLGAGKTTLIQALLRQWGIQEMVASPTFTYLNQYQTILGLKIYHFDLYRLNNLDSFLELGFDEYLVEPKCIILIEWPEIIYPLLFKMSERVCAINLSCKSDQKRQITLSLEVDHD